MCSNFTCGFHPKGLTPRGQRSIEPASWAIRALSSNLGDLFPSGDDLKDNQEMNSLIKVPFRNTQVFLGCLFPLRTGNKPEKKKKKTTQQTTTVPLWSNLRYGQPGEGQLSRSGLAGFRRPIRPAAADLHGSLGQALRAPFGRNPAVPAKRPRGATK